MRRHSRGVLSSAGIVLFRRTPRLEVLVAHPGGPFWRNRDAGAWSIPKGLLQEGEAPLEAALREFTEETGLGVDSSPLIDLGSIRQASGKTVFAWGAEGDADPEVLRSNTFSLEWPRGSGEIREYPEMDRFLWADPDTARRKLNRAQGPFVGRLEAALYLK